MNSYLFQGYLHVSECNEPNWKRIGQTKKCSSSEYCHGHSNRAARCLQCFVCEKGIVG